MRGSGDDVRIADFQALTFDCYGTLIDWETGLLQVLRPWEAKHSLLVDDEELLAAYGAAEAASEADNPTLLYSDILRDVHQRLSKQFGVIPDPADAQALADSVGDWPPFPDTVAALRELKRDYKLVIVSNVDHRSFARTQKLLQIDFDAVVTAEDIGVYKPDLRMFQRAIDVLAGMGISHDEILHVAQSLYHDYIPAKSIGLSTVWVDRRRGKLGSGATKPPTIDVRPDWTVTGLAELATLLRQWPIG